MPYRWDFNQYSYLAEASTALSVSLTDGSSLSAVVTIPLLDRVFGAVVGQALRFTAPPEERFRLAMARQ